MKCAAVGNEKHFISRQPTVYTDCFDWLHW